MGRFKEVIHNYAEHYKEKLSEVGNDKEEALELMYIELGASEFGNFFNYVDIIEDMIGFDDDTWIDPAGGTHREGDDPAAAYESYNKDIIMPGIND